MSKWLEDQQEENTTAFVEARLRGLNIINSYLQEVLKSTQNFYTHLWFILTLFNTNVSKWIVMFLRFLVCYTSIGTKPSLQKHFGKSYLYCQMLNCQTNLFIEDHENCQMFLLSEK